MQFRCFFLPTSTNYLIFNTFYGLSVRILIKNLCFKGAQIGPRLKNLAERRTDIFSSEESVIGRKVCM